MGPSLGGALRPGGSNTMIDGLLLPHSPSTDKAMYQWNCSDADLRRHMANEIMKLSSEKKAPSSSPSTQTYLFTKVAKPVLFDPLGPPTPPSNETPDTTESNTHIPAHPHCMNRLHKHQTQLNQTLTHLLTPHCMNRLHENDHQVHTTIHISQHHQNIWNREVELKLPSFNYSAKTHTPSQQDHGIPLAHGPSWNTCQSVHNNWGSPSRRI